MKSCYCVEQHSPWHKATLPAELGFPENVALAAAQWQLRITAGQLTVQELDQVGMAKMSWTGDRQTPLPQLAVGPRYQLVNGSDDLECQLHYFCAAEDYYRCKGYDLSRTHSEVVAAMPYVRVGKALDLGCGNGRNSLYLNLLGFDVVGVDRNGASIEYLQQIIAQQALAGIRVAQRDLTELPWQQQYDFILSTVVLMFLAPETIPPLLAKMQAHTVTGGVNLIVSAMDTEDYPCRVGFPFTFRSNELLNYYQGWDIIRYNEHVGELHKTDEQGNRINMRFATLLARKL